MLVHGSISGFERDGLDAFEPTMVNEGKKGLDGEDEEVEVQHKKLKEEEEVVDVEEEEEEEATRKGMIKGESNFLSTLSLF